MFLAILFLTIRRQSLKQKSARLPFLTSNVINNSMRNINSPYKMKYSTFINSTSPRPRPGRQSQTSFAYSQLSAEVKQQQSPSRKCSFKTNMLPARSRLSNKVSPSRISRQKSQKGSNLEHLMNQLKSDYPRLSQKNKIKRAKSQQSDLSTTSNFKSKPAATSIQDIQSKLARFSRKNTQERKMSPLKGTFSPMKSIQKMDKAALKCKQLCHELKKKVLKETVSTTATNEEYEKKLTIGQFTQVKLLGHGKFSKVYLVQHKVSGMLLALKIIKKQTIRKQKFANQLAREIVIQTFFNHVNLVKLYGCFGDKNNVYLILEYCSGGELYDVFKVKSKLRDDEWIPVMKGICEGLFSLHLHDVIHRDLKPENVLLAFGLPKVGDFGWAVYTPMDRRQTFCGTPLYISPQLLKGSSYNKQVDIWALGVMMFEFITGRIPFKLDQNKPLCQIINQKIIFPDNLSPNCANLLTMVLNKDPSTRICIMDILQHPYLKDSLSTSTTLNHFLRTGR